MREGTTAEHELAALERGLEKHRAGKAFRGDAAVSKTAERGSSPRTRANKEKIDADA